MVVVKGARRKTAASMVKAKCRELEALDMRRSGASYDTIAAALGMSREGARDCVSRALAALNTEATETATEVLRLEIDRLDAMIAGLWPKAQKGDPAAIDRVLRIQERRARYLGLDSVVGGPEVQVSKTVNEDGTVSTRVVFEVMSAEDVAEARARQMLPAE